MNWIAPFDLKMNRKKNAVVAVVVADVVVVVVDVDNSFAVDGCCTSSHLIGLFECSDCCCFDGKEKS